MTEFADLKQDAKAHAAEVAAKAKATVQNEASARADHVRHSAAEGVEKVADAAAAAGAQFDPNTLHAEAARHVADRIEGVASHIRGADIDTIVRETSDYARRNPLLFIGVAAAIGFAATRFLKAQSPEKSFAGSPSHDDPWSAPADPRGTDFKTDGSVFAELNGERHA
ncbi:hypothetical protein N9L47_02220 [Rhodobacteraceae bacterium]|nr:hypothetical protein [Paracoccaceae bacterium]